MQGLNSETRLCSILCYLLWNFPCFLTVPFWLDASSSKKVLKPSWFIWGFSLQRELLKSLGKVLNLTVTWPFVCLALHWSIPAACMHWCIGVMETEQLSQAFGNELTGISSLSDVNFSIRMGNIDLFTFFFRYRGIKEKFVLFLSCCQVQLLMEYS